MKRGRTGANKGDAVRTLFYVGGDTAVQVLRRLCIPVVDFVIPGGSGIDGGDHHLLLSRERAECQQGVTAAKGIAQTFCPHAAVQGNLRGHLELDDLALRHHQLRQEKAVNLQTVTGFGVFTKQRVAVSDRRLQAVKADTRSAYGR